MLPQSHGVSKRYIMGIGLSKLNSWRLDYVQNVQVLLIKWMVSVDTLIDFTQVMYGNMKCVELWKMEFYYFYPKFM